MLAVLLLARRDEPFDLVFRLVGRGEELQVLLRTISVVGKERCPDCCSMSSTIGFNCLLSLLASVTVCPTINSNVGSTAACAL